MKHRLNLDNRTALSSPDTGNAGMTYDPAGNVLTSTDARGKVTTFTYDALNRVTSVSYATGTASVFEYDGGTGGTATDIGHLTKMSDESGQTRLSYDGMGRLLSKVQTTNSASGATATLSTSYTYGTEGSATGKLSSVTYPSGNRINYAYDVSGRVSGITLNPTDLAGGTNTATTTVLLSNISYSPFGRAQSWTWGNSGPAQPGTYARTFDLDGRMTSYPLGNSAFGGLIRTVVYDAANRITSLTHTGAGTPSSFDQTFGYDDLNRLTSFTSSTESLGYSYDANGNRTQVRISATAYNNTIASASNRLSSTAGPVPNKSDSFDAAGNTTSDGTVTYTYSDRGRLKRSTKAAVLTDYLYNAVGQRVSKTGTTTPTGVNFYAYDVQGHVAGEYTAGGAAMEETVYLNDTPVAVLNSSGVYYVYADHINTPRVITNSTDNTIVWRWDQTDPFGRDVPNENPSGLATFSYNLRFPGQVFDVESGLHYNYNRDYDPQTGRYVQSDPIGLDGGINTYSYVGGNPVNNTDPYGLYSWNQFKSDVTDATGGCSNQSFTDDVVSNFDNVQDSTALLKTGISLGLGGTVAKTYGGLTVGAAAAQGLAEYRSGIVITGLAGRTFAQAATTAGATWAINGVLIKGSYDAGVLVGSLLRTAVNRAASSGCGCK